MIGAINGACAGIGFVQMASFDVVFASTVASSSSFARRTSGRAGHQLAAARRIGTAKAMDLLLSAGRARRRGFAMGLVNRVCEPDELLPAALAYARDLAVNCSPASMAHQRQVLDDWERSGRVATALARHDVGDGEHPDFVEGVTSFSEEAVAEVRACPPASTCQVDQPLMAQASRS